MHAQRRHPHRHRSKGARGGSFRGAPAPEFSAHFLERLGEGALALGLGAAPALAKNNDDDEDKKQRGKRNNGGVSDVDILNYALVLERLEYEFYRRHLQRFSENKIEGASIFDGFGNKVRSHIY